MRNLKILLAVLLLTGSAIVFSQGLSAGAGVTYSISGSKFSGTVLKVTLGEKEPMTLLTQAGKGVKLLMKEIKRIEKTGQSWKITPNWSYTESSYDVYTFTLMTGKTQQLAIYQWPVFDLNNSDGSQDLNRWLNKLDWIETGATAISTNNGLAVGGQVEYKLKGTVVTGSVLKIYGSLAKSPVTCMTEKGGKVSLMLQDIKSVTNLNRSAKITPIWSYTESSYELYEVLRTNGYKETLAFYESPIIDVASATGRTEFSQWVVKMEYIKAL
jgi:hypothetical protein